MRINELEYTEELLNMKDDETLIWKLDYEIIDCYEIILDAEGYFNHTEYPYSIVKIFLQELLNDINENMNLNYVLKEDIKVTKDIAQDIITYIRNKGCYNGTIGSKCIDKN